MPLPIPKLSGIPLVGHIREFRRDRIGLLERLRRECGDIGTMQLVREVVVISSPELARVVLVERADAFEKGPIIRRFSRPVLGEGLLAATNEAQRPRRRMLSPAFAPPQIAKLAPSFVRRTRLALEKLPREGVVDLVPLLTRLTLEIVGDTLFGADIGEEASTLGGALTDVMRYVTGMIDDPFRMPLSIPTPGNRQARASMRKLDETIADLVSARRAALGRGEPAADLVSSMILARDPNGERAALGDREIRDEAMNMLLAGHETTASTLAWALDRVMRHPALADAMRDELLGVVGTREPKYEDLPQLPKLTAFLEETLRIYPSVHSLGRQASRAVDVGPYQLARGTVLIVSNYLLHRRQDLFADPLTFDPERFSPSRRGSIPRYAYMPFGAGPRTCIGGHFAIVEASLVLATMLQAVSLAPVDQRSPAPEMLVTLRPAGPVRARVTLRDRA